MADLAKCVQEKCKKRFNCYRYVKPAAKHNQVYMKPEESEIDNACSFYIEKSIKIRRCIACGGK